MSNWNAQYAEGDYRIQFDSKEKEKAKAVEKVCAAIMDGHVSTPDDVQIAKHGTWEYIASNSTGNIYRCSNCRKWHNPNKDDVAGLRAVEKPDFCYHCGAIMDEGEGE